MVDIVKRVSKITGTPTLDLRMLWEAEAERALLRNNGVFDSRAFIIASMSFLKKTGAKLPSLPSIYNANVDAST